MIPLALAAGQQAEDLLNDRSDLVVARISGAVDGLLFDATQDSAFATAMLECFRHSFAADSGGR